MTEESQSQLVRDAEQNENGDLIYTKVWTDESSGQKKEIHINVSAINEPGIRRTGNHEILRLEAEMMDNGKELKNAAKPSDAEIAKQHVKWCEWNGYRPAWELCDYPGWEA